MSLRRRSRSGNALPLGTAVVLSIGGLLTPNPNLTVACILTLLVLLKLLWHPGEPPVLLYAAGYQWMQVSMKVFHADYRGEPLTRLAYSGSIERAVMLSLTALILLALGMRVGVRRYRLIDLQRPQEEARRISLNRLFTIYVV